jgi:hypothetical protein
MIAIEGHDRRDVWLVRGSRGRIRVLLVELGMVEVIHAFGDRRCKRGLARPRDARNGY